MSNFPQPVQRAIDQSYNFKFGDYITRGFDLAKREPGLLIGYTLVFLLITVVLQIIPLVGPLVGSLIVTPCLTAGYYLFFARIRQNRNREFSSFFEGFEYLSPLLIMTLIQFGIFLAVLSIIGLLAYITGGGEMGGLQVALFFVLGVPLVYLGIAWVLAPYLIVFYNMQAWAALEASRQIVSKDWVSFFLFALAVGFIIIVPGALTLFIGLLFLVPAGIAMYFALFEDIVGLPGEANDDVIDHLITK